MLSSLDDHNRPGGSRIPSIWEPRVREDPTASEEDARAAVGLRSSPFAEPRIVTRHVTSVPCTIAFKKARDSSPSQSDDGLARRALFSAGPSPDVEGRPVAPSGSVRPTLVGRFSRLGRSFFAMVLKA